MPIRCELGKDRTERQLEGEPGVPRAARQRHLCLVEIQQKPHLHSGHMQGLVPKLQLSPAQPCPLKSPMWSHVQDWVVLT